MLKKPFSKLVGVLSAFTAYIAAQSYEALVDSFDNFMPAIIAEPVAHIVLGVAILITLFSHALPGTGGETLVRKPTILTNFTKR